MLGNIHPASIKTHGIRLLTVALVVLFGCDRTRMDRGYEYFPDMAHGQSYETWSENPAMEDGKTMREPVAGSVPRHMEPHPYAADFEGRAKAAQDLVHPLEITPELLEQGKGLNGVYCMHCHGEQGDGKGSLHTSGKYVIPPASLITPQVIEQPSGEIFHVISMGWGVMGAHATLIRPEDRWKIEAFIEQVIQEQ